MTQIPVLERASVGAPLTRVGISLIPVYLHGDNPPALSADTSAVSVTEAPNANVPTLTVTNAANLPTLVTEGEVLRGGQQDRVVNTSVLIPAGADIELPVSCVEHGRWGGGRAFSRSTQFASRRVRRAKNATVANSVRQTGTRRSDQGLVWSAVAFELDRLNLRSDTGSFLATEDFGGVDTRLDQARAEVAALGPLPGQRGVVVAHGSRIVSCDLFASTELLAAQWSGLVNAWFLDAPEVDGRQRPGLRAALRFVRRLGTTPGESTPAVGLGREVHIRTPRFCAQVLLADDAVVHASAFTTAA